MEERGDSIPPGSKLMVKSVQVIGDQVVHMLHTSRSAHLSAGLDPTIVVLEPEQNLDLPHKLFRYFGVSRPVGRCNSLPLGFVDLKFGQRFNQSLVMFCNFLNRNLLCSGRTSAACTMCRDLQSEPNCRKTYVYFVLLCGQKNR